MIAEKHCFPQNIFGDIGKNRFCQTDLKQVRTNIGLADTLIPSLFIYLIYMGTGPYDSIKIIFGYHVNITIYNIYIYIKYI